ncbi:hypothetical protein GF356_10535 [candidate division GN15 bacterium]|nr:hypothetical protein [candidate division GN15 bacterium]
MGVYTTADDPQVDRDIDSQVRLVADRINRVLGCRSLYLTGAFGRGEGLVAFESGMWRAVNDLDFVVVADECASATRRLDAASRELERELKIDFVDIACYSTSTAQALPLTMLNYDLVHGNQLVSGEHLIRGRFTEGLLPPFEVVRLLCNRCAGLLSIQVKNSHDNSRYRRYQRVKACIAVGDAAVWLRSGYHHSYSHRRMLFRQISDSGNLPFRLSGAHSQAIEHAYSAKLGEAELGVPLNDEQMREILERAFVALAEEVSDCKPRQPLGVDSAERHFRNAFGGGLAPILAAAASSLPHKLRHHLRQRVLFSQPRFVCRPTRTRTNAMRRFWFFPEPWLWRWPSSTAIRLWFKYCH